MSGMPKIEISHVGINVTDIDKMVDFYTRVLGYTVTDRGAFRNGQLVFMSRDVRDHHQIVMGTGRPEGSYNTINQISFRVDGLPALRQARQTLLDNGVTKLDPASHGNAWSVYFWDPEGNRLEFFTDTPWYVAQPHREDLDFELSDEEIHARTKAEIENDESFELFDDWRKKISRTLEPVD
jgi:catechol 2,3-dioxygenase-like lactoylglutathione lyase family enzyme